MALQIGRRIQSLHINYITKLRQISSTNRNMQKALENLEKNPFYEKYANRIAALQKTSPEEFMERVERQQKAKEEEKRNKFTSVDTRSGPLLF